MTSPQQPALTSPWRKSSYSDTSGNCVEIAQAGTTIAVRDSKNPDGGILLVSPQAWLTFTSHIKYGDRDT